MTKVNKAFASGFILHKINTHTTHYYLVIVAVQRFGASTGKMLYGFAPISGCPTVSGGMVKSWKNGADCRI